MKAISGLQLLDEAGQKAAKKQQECIEAQMEETIQALTEQFTEWNEEYEIKRYGEYRIVKLPGERGDE